MTVSPRDTDVIRVWTCDECGYWRQEKSTGVHKTWNRADPRGRLVVHELREAEYVPVARVHALERAAERVLRVYDLGDWPFMPGMEAFRAVVLEGAAPSKDLGGDVPSPVVPT